MFSSRHQFSLLLLLPLCFSLWLSACSFQKHTTHDTTTKKVTKKSCHAKDLYKNRQQALEQLHQYDGSFNLSCATGSLRKDKAFITEFLTSRYLSNAEIFAFVDKSFRKDKEFITRVVVDNDENYLALAYADASLRKDKAFMLKMLSITSHSLEFADEAFKKDKSFVWQAVKSNFGYSAIKNAHISLRQDRDFVLAIIRRDGEALAFVEDRFKKDKQMVLLAVKDYPRALQSADKSLQTDPDILAAARIRQAELENIWKQHREKFKQHDKDQSKINFHDQSFFESSCFSRSNTLFG